MGLEQDIRGWFDAHQKTRAFFKQAVIAGIGFLVANQAAIMAQLPEAWMPLGMAFAGGIGMLLDWMQKNTVWPVVGARAPLPGKSAKKR